MAILVGNVFICELPFTRDHFLSEMFLLTIIFEYHNNQVQDLANQQVQDLANQQVHDLADQKDHIYVGYSKLVIDFFRKGLIFIATCIIFIGFSEIIFSLNSYSVVQLFVHIRAVALLPF